MPGTKILMVEKVALVFARIHLILDCFQDDSLISWVQWSRNYKHKHKKVKLCQHPCYSCAFDFCYPCWTKYLFSKYFTHRIYEARSRKCWIWMKLLNFQWIQSLDIVGVRPRMCICHYYWHIHIRASDTHLLTSEVLPVSELKPESMTKTFFYLQEHHFFFVTESHRTHFWKHVLHKMLACHEFTFAAVVVCYSW